MKNNGIFPIAALIKIKRVLCESGKLIMWVGVTKNNDYNPFNSDLIIFLFQFYTV